MTDDEGDPTVLDFRNTVELMRKNDREDLGRERVALEVKERRAVELRMSIQDLGLLFDRMTAERDAMKAKLDECLATKDDIANMCSAAIRAAQAVSESSSLRAEIAAVRAENDLLKRVNIVLADDQSASSHDVTMWLIDTMPMRAKLEAVANKAMRRILRFDEHRGTLHVGPEPMRGVSVAVAARVETAVANAVLAALVAVLPEVSLVADGKEA